MDLALVVLGDDTRSDFDLLSELEHTGQNGTTSNTSLELVHLGTRLVDIERSDDDQSRGRGKVADRYGNTLDNVLVHRVNVVLELRRDGNDWRAIRNGTCEKKK